MKDLNRREFAALIGAAAGAIAIPDVAFAEPKALTAAEAIARIQKQVGVPWQLQTVDTFKAGDPSTIVRGISTTFMSTLEVLKKSAAAGCNLIITHEPTYWNHQDETKDFASDPVFAAKQKFIADNKLVIWRFHDHWHRRQPDGVLEGVIKTFNWDSYRTKDATTPNHFTIPRIALKDLAARLHSTLGTKGMRVVGNPDMLVSKVAVSPGYVMLEGAMKYLQASDVELLICGELREWEGVEYAKDAVAAEHNKALMVLGHTASEDPGMEECAKWLKTFIPEVPIRWIPTGEPYWSPA